MTSQKFLDSSLESISKISMEMTLMEIGRLCRQMAEIIPSTITGKEALIAFAKTIENTVTGETKKETRQ